MSELKNHIYCPYFGSEFREKRVKNRVKRDFLVSLENLTVSLDFSRFSLNSDPKLDSKSDFVSSDKKTHCIFKIRTYKIVISSLQFR